MKDCHNCIRLLLIITIVIGALFINGCKKESSDRAVKELINNLSQSKEKCVEILSQQKCYDEKAQVIPCPKLYNESIQKSCEELNT